MYTSLDFSLLRKCLQSYWFYNSFANIQLLEVASAIFNQFRGKSSQSIKEHLWCFFWGPTTFHLQYQFPLMINVLEVHVTEIVTCCWRSKESQFLKDIQRDGQSFKAHAIFQIQCCWLGHCKHLQLQKCNYNYLLLAKENTPTTERHLHMWMIVQGLWLMSDWV